MAEQSSCMGWWQPVNRVPSSEGGAHMSAREATASSRAKGWFGGRVAPAMVVVAVLVGFPGSRATADHVVRVQLLDQGRVVDGDARVRVSAACRPSGEVLEAFVTVSQDAASGQASFGLTCTGAVQRFVVTVRSFGDP